MYRCANRRRKGVSSGTGNASDMPCGSTYVRAFELLKVKVRVNLSRNKSWRLRRSMERWTSILTVDIRYKLQRQSYQLSAVAALHPQVNSLVLILSETEWTSALLNANRGTRYFKVYKDPTGNQTRDVTSCGTVPWTNCAITRPHLN
jgi:hypothetical protein